MRVDKEEPAVYIENIPCRKSDCPVYTTAPIPELDMEALPL